MAPAAAVGALGQRADFEGQNGHVVGIIVSLWTFGGVAYALVRDASGGYHGYRAEEVGHD